MHTSALFPRFVLFAFCTLILIAAGCGRKSPLRPPEDVRPKVIVDLNTSNTAEGIQLSWSRPSTYADGSRMLDLAGFIVERAETADPRAVFTRLTNIEVSDRDRFRQIKRLQYVDANTIVGALYRYRVVSFTLDRYFSEPSNVVAVERTQTGEEQHAPLPAPQQ